MSNKERKRNTMARLYKQLERAIICNCYFKNKKKNDSGHASSKTHRKHNAKIRTKEGKLIMPNTPIIYSYAYKDALLDLAKQAMRFIEIGHPDIKLVCDIKVEHWNEFLEEKAKTCSTATLKQYCTKIRKMRLCVNSYLRKANVDWKTGLRAPASQKTEHEEIQRTQQMTREHYNIFIEWLRQQKTWKCTQTIIASELSARFGFRVQGTSRYKPINSHLQNDSILGYGQVSIVEKGNRLRFIDNKTYEDKVFLERINEGKPPLKKIVGLSEYAINEQIRLALEATGLKKYYPLTSMHAIRKMWADETYNMLLNEKKMDEDEVICTVNKWLGHSEGRDIELLAVYSKTFAENLKKNPENYKHLSRNARRSEARKKAKSGVTNNATISEKASSPTSENDTLSQL